MLKVIKKFFAFCGKENRRKFMTSVWLSVFQAMFEAMKIPAIAAMIRALMRGNVETTDILLSLGIMLISIIGAGLIKAKATMLQTEGGYDTCARKRVEIAEHMRYLPMGYFNTNSLGQITSVTTNVISPLSCWQDSRCFFWPTAVCRPLPENWREQRSALTKSLWKRCWSICRA